MNLYINLHRNLYRNVFIKRSPPPHIMEKIKEDVESQIEDFTNTITINGKS